MTAETARQVLMILRGNYPNDAWKLEGDRAYSLGPCSNNWEDTPTDLF